MLQEGLGQERPYNGMILYKTKAVCSCFDHVDRSLPAFLQLVLDDVRAHGWLLSWSMLRGKVWRIKNLYHDV